MHSNIRGGINNFEPFKILEPTAAGAWPKIDWSSLKMDSAVSINTVPHNSRGKYWNIAMTWLTYITVSTKLN